MFGGAQVRVFGYAQVCVLGYAHMVIFEYAQLGVFRYAYADILGYAQALVSWRQALHVIAIRILLSWQLARRGALQRPSTVHISELILVVGLSFCFFFGPGLLCSLLDFKACFLMMAGCRGTCWFSCVCRASGPAALANWRQVLADPQLYSVALASVGLWGPGCSAFCWSAHICAPSLCAWRILFIVGGVFANGAAQLRDCQWCRRSTICLSWCALGDRIAGPMRADMALGLIAVHACAMASTGPVLKEHASALAPDEDIFKYQCSLCSRDKLCDVAGVALRTGKVRAFQQDVMISDWQHYCDQFA